MDCWWVRGDNGEAGELSKWLRLPAATACYRYPLPGEGRALIGVRRAKQRDVRIPVYPVHNVVRGVDHPATLVTTADRDICGTSTHSYKFICCAIKRTKRWCACDIRIDVTWATGGASRH
ncbi:hypothetical protein OH492_14060 [Vibrio chagasii]|nr:hypothetical protein [Vibrio chagasii]